MTRSKFCVLATLCAGFMMTFQSVRADEIPKGKEVPFGSTDGGPVCWQGCPADPNHDAVVNIDDLLAIISAWGVFGGYTDVNGDGVTNIDDLLAVITAWGPCPAPSNNDCANPLWLNSNVVFDVCTRDATTDGNAENGCGFCCGDPQIHKDVWYWFSTSVFGGNYTMEIDLCGSDFDTKVAVYRLPTNSWDCNMPAWTLVACNDDTGTYCNLSSRVRFPMAASSMYAIRIGGYNGQSGITHVNVHAWWSGDECLNAIDLGQVTSTNTLTATGNNFPGNQWTPGYYDPQASCTSFPDGVDVWYKFHIGCGGNVLGAVTTCHTFTNFDTILELFHGNCDYPNLISIGCNDDYFGNPACQLSNGLHRKSLVDLPIQASPGYYYVRISGYNGAAGSYQISIGLSCIN